MGTRDRAVPALTVLLVGAYVTVTLLCVSTTAYDVWGGLLLGPLLLLASLPLLHRITRDDDVLTYRLAAWALVAKLLAALVRYWQSYVLYDGGADGERYHDAGTRIAQAIHDGLPWAANGPIPGTGFMEEVTGYVYWAIGPSRVGGFFFFSWLGFWGLLGFQRAFATALPDGAVRRFTLMVFFLPSLLFWPSSIGKEAWLVFSLGIATYGGALVLVHRNRGLLWAAAGLTAAYMVRPHMAGILAAALLVALLVRPLKPGSVFGPVVRAVTLTAVLAGGAYVTTHAAQVFAPSVSGTATSVSDVLSSTSDRTDEGGSSFDATPVSSPADLPGAAVAVLLRPFPQEANNLQALAASLETFLVLALAWRGRQGLRTLHRAVLTRPLVALAATYALLFVVAFSGFSNFGVLTRQRVQVYPFLFVLLCAPQLRRRPPARRPATYAGTTRRPHARSLEDIRA